MNRLILSNLDQMIIFPNHFNVDVYHINIYMFVYLTLCGTSSILRRNFSSSLCSYSVPWLCEGLRMLLPHLPILRYPLPDGTLPVVIEFVSPTSRRSSSRAFPCFQVEICSVHRLPLRLFSYQRSDVSWCMCVCVCVCVCVRACVRACVRGACVRVCVRSQHLYHLEEIYFSSLSATSRPIIFILIIFIVGCVKRGSCHTVRNRRPVVRVTNKMNSYLFYKLASTNSYINMCNGTGTRSYNLFVTNVNRHHQNYDVNCSCYPTCLYD